MITPFLTELLGVNPEPSLCGFSRHCANITNTTCMAKVTCMCHYVAPPHLEEKITEFTGQWIIQPI